MFISGGTEENIYIDDRGGFADSFEDFVEDGLQIFTSTVDAISGTFDDVKDKVEDVSKTIEETKIFKKKQPETLGAQSFFAQAEKQQNNNSLLIVLVLAVLLIAIFKKK